MGKINDIKCKRCNIGNYLKEDLAKILQNNTKQKWFRLKCMFCGHKNKVNKFEIIRKIKINKFLDE